jgi:hypothetical protein
MLGRPNNMWTISPNNLALVPNNAQPTEGSGGGGGSAPTVRTAYFDLNPLTDDEDGYCFVGSELDPLYTNEDIAIYNTAAFTLTDETDLVTLHAAGHRLESPGLYTFTFRYFAEPADEPDVGARLQMSVFEQLQDDPENPQNWNRVFPAKREIEYTHPVGNDPVVLLQFTLWVTTPVFFQADIVCFSDTSGWMVYSTQVEIQLVSFG